MRINVKYGAAVGTLAAAIGMLGPMAAQAGHNPGSSVPVPARAGAISVQAPATHLLAITGKSVVLSSTLERQAWQRDTGIAQRDNNPVGNVQKRPGFQGQKHRMLPQDYCRYGYDRGHCCDYGRHGYSGMGNSGGNSYRYCYCDYGVYDHGHGWTYGRCCGYYPYHYRYGWGYGHRYDCVSHYGTQTQAVMPQQEQAVIPQQEQAAVLEQPQAGIPQAATTSRDRLLMR
jgi:hypothetical protein